MARERDNHFAGGPKSLGDWLLNDDSGAIGWPESESNLSEPHAARWRGAWCGQFPSSLHLASYFRSVRFSDVQL